MKILFEAELIQDHAGMLELRLMNGFGNPAIHVAKDRCQIVEEPAFLITENPDKWAA